MSIDNRPDDQHDNQQEDAELARFLRGEDDLSSSLKDLAQPAPPAALDAAILGKIEAALQAEKAARAPQPEAANDAIDPAKTNAVPKRRYLRSWWQVPLGLAAGVLLTIAFRSQFEGNRQPDSAALVPPQQVAVVSAPPAFQPQEQVAPAAKMAPSQVPAATSPPGDIAREVSMPRTAPSMAFAPPPALPAPPPPPVSSPAPMPAPAPAMSTPLAPGSIGEPPTVAARAARASQEADGAQPRSIATNEFHATVQQELKQRHEAIAHIEASNEKEAVRKAETEAIEPLRRTADKPAAAGAESRVGAVAAGQIFGKLDDRAVATDNGKVSNQPAVSGKPIPMDTPKAAVGAADVPAAATAPIASAPAPSNAQVAVTSERSARKVAPPSAGMDSPFAAPAPMSGPVPSYSLITPDPSASDAVLAKSGYTGMPGNSVTSPQNLSSHLRPDAWLAVIEQKLKARDNKGAVQEWTRFRRIYPDFQVDKTLEANLKALQALPKPPNSSQGK